MDEKELEKDINVPSKLSDEEIAISLQCCIDSNCDECPYMKKKIDCAGGRHEKDCIELINKLGRTTTRNSWKNKFLNLVKEKEELQKDYIELDLECRELRTRLDDMENKLKQAVKDKAKEILRTFKVWANEYRHNDTVIDENGERPITGNEKLNYLYNYLVGVYGVEVE